MCTVQCDSLKFLGCMSRTALPFCQAVFQASSSFGEVELAEHRVLRHAKKVRPLFHGTFYVSVMDPYVNQFDHSLDCAQLRGCE